MGGKNTKGMTFMAEISKGVTMCVLDEITTEGVGKGATMRVSAQKNTHRGVCLFFPQKYVRG